MDNRATNEAAMPGKRARLQEKVRLSKSVVAAAEPRDREYCIWDTRVAGFGLRVRPSGSKTFVFTYRTGGGRKGAVRRMTIKAATPDAAFEQAKKLAGQYHGGSDPAADRAAAADEAMAARNALSTAAVLDCFVRDHAKVNLAPKTAAEYERLADKILKPQIGKTKVDALAPKDVAAMYHALREKPTQAALAVRVLSSALSWAEEFGLRQPGPNPARIRLKAARRRTRLFSDREVARLQAAIDELESENGINATVALGLRLLFATGCRAGEICGLQWSNVDFETGQLRWPNTKTGYLEKPLTAEARALLKKAPRIVGVDWVLPGAKAKPHHNGKMPTHLRVETLEGGFEKVMQRARVEARENATLHLIRHWFATKIYTDQSIPLPVQMAIVGHSSVATAMRYAHVAREQVSAAAAKAAKRRAASIKTASKQGEIAALPGLRA